MFRKLATAALAYALLVVGLAAVGDRVTLPTEAAGMAFEAGSLNAALHMALGKPVTTDFLADYASAKALRNGDDPYQILDDLVIEAGGPQWEIETTNTHPPTLLALVLPTTVLDYEHALIAWVIAMVTALATTIYLAGTRWWLAVPLAIAISCCWPAAYGIGNPVPIIGLGAVIAYRYRDRPWIAGVGLTLAAAPKLSGLLLAGAFLITARWRPVAWAAAFTAILALVPALFYRGVWARYLDAGVDAIRVIAGGYDNASLLHAGTRVGIPSVVVLAVLVALAVALAARLRDVYWPTVWLMVAALPIAWMYAVLTFVPIVVRLTAGGRRAAIAATLIAVGVSLGTPATGRWPVYSFPVVVGLILVGLALAERSADNPFWPTVGSSREPTEERSARLLLGPRAH